MSTAFGTCGKIATTKFIKSITNTLCRVACRHHATVAVHEVFWSDVNESNGDMFDDSMHQMKTTWNVFSCFDAFALRANFESTSFSWYFGLVQKEQQNWQVTFSLDEMLPHKLHRKIVSKLCRGLFVCKTKPFVISTQYACQQYSKISIENIIHNCSFRLL